MIQGGGGPRLSVKPHQAVMIRRHFRGQNLERDLPAEPGVGGSIDFTHSARTKQRVDLVVTEMFGGVFAVECVASNVELEPLTVEEAVGDATDDPEARALLEGVLKITGGELVDAPEVR